MLTDVKRLVDPRIASPVERACDVRPGDLIKMTSDYGDHVAMACGVTAEAIEYAASEDEIDGLGGVRFRTIQVAQPALGLEHQVWQQQRIYTPGKHGDGVWRLNALAGVV